jgi:phosphatidylserine/phosphatidylglycerophosphate/cardiolipin synthase-like enzyme
MSNDFQVVGTSAAAPFTLTIHRGEGMALLAMNWKNGKPPSDFVGFGIESREPGAGAKFFPVNNRLSFSGPASTTTKDRTSSLLAPIQLFRWVHFPYNADLLGAFTYRVTPVFMDENDKLTYGPAQEADIVLARETYPGKLNVTFTRGYIASQAFIDYYVKDASELKTLLPATAEEGLDFIPTHPKAAEALAWMGFEARSAILAVLDEALADTNAQVRVVAYDLNEPEILTRLEQLGARLRAIIDDSADHGPATSPESDAARRLAASAGPANVKRQHMGNLQHNKTIVVQGPNVQAAICGSTNFSWRGIYVQNNHAVVLRGNLAVQLFRKAFDDYWNSGSAAAFSQTASAGWNDLGLAGIDAKVTFSPRAASKAVLASIADDIRSNTKSSLFYSLAFLYQTPGAVVKALEKLQKDDKIFSFGVSDHEVGVLRLTNPSGLVRVVYPATLGKALPPPFKPEQSGGSGTRMHHKFVVIDFNEPTARVYFGSFNFSKAADGANGENLTLIKDRRIATSFMIEAVRIFDHYAFRVAYAKAKKAGKPLNLQRPPRAAGEKPWWDRFYTNSDKVKDRELFA